MTDPNAYEQTAIELNADQLLALEARRSPAQNSVLVVLSGPCPHCGDPTSFGVPLIPPRTVPGADPGEDLTDLEWLIGKLLKFWNWLLSIQTPATEVRAQIVMTCRCGVHHPAVPPSDDKVGCGRSWRVGLAQDLSRVLVPGVPTADEVAFEEQIRKFNDQRVTNVRDGAEKWRTGLALLLGLITAVSLVKGKDTISGLPLQIQYVVGVLLALGLVAAAWGAWRAMRAAFGNPTLKLPITPDELQARNVADGAKALTDLAIAKWLTVISLAAVALAVGLTWYLQKPPSPPAFVNVVQAKDHLSYCGELLKGDGSTMVVQKSDKNFRVYTIAKDISSFQIVDACRSPNPG